MRKEIVGNAGFFRIRARQGMDGGHASPSGPAATHLVPRTCASAAWAQLGSKKNLLRDAPLTPLSKCCNSRMGVCVFWSLSGPGVG